MFLSHCIAIAAFVWVAQARSVCINDYSVSVLTDKNNVCNHLEKLILCLGNDKDATADDTDTLNAETEKYRDQCEVIVKPSITSVGRQLRIVTEEDVVFNRFRREETGIFELRDRITKVNDNVTDRLDRLNDNVTDRLDRFNNFVHENNNNVTRQVHDIHDDINASIGILETKFDLLESSVTAKQVKHKWYNLGGIDTKIPFDFASSIRVGGSNLDYFYDGTSDPTVVCTLTAGDNTKKITYGYVDFEESTGTYFINCPTPRLPALNGPTQYTLSIKAGQTDIEYVGLQNADKVSTAALVAGLEISKGKATMVLSSGHTAGTYACSITTRDGVVKTQPATISSNFRAATCVLPIFIGSNSIYIQLMKNTQEVPFARFVAKWLNYDSCKNEIKDGDETDVDCGGACEHCDLGKTCQVSDDCKDADEDEDDAKALCEQNVCKKFYDGTSANSAGETCKSIKFAFSGSTNGVYWLRGKNNVLSPTQLYCWMEDRDGGGWMLGMKHGYHSYGGGGRSSDFSTGEVGMSQTTSSSLLTSKSGYEYKVKDDVIRAVIGQSSSSNSKELFDVMADQAGINSYYTSQNREYVIMRNYGAHWEFTGARTVRNSNNFGTPTQYQNHTSLESYSIPNFNGKDPVGNGKLIWKGKVKCNENTNGRRGIYCVNQPIAGSVVVGSSKPSGGPNGGRGCTQNLGRNRWTGSAHFCMWDTNRDSYLYMCNGPQHSSSYDMIHRWWFRSSRKTGNV